MPEDEPFRDLICRVRAGDEQAAYELVRRYEPAIRAAVRVRLSDPGLRRVLDSMDVCQSVFLNFFMRAASGQFELETPEHLLRLLVTMARNKLTNLARKQRAARRDQRRVQKGVSTYTSLSPPAGASAQWWPIGSCCASSACACPTGYR